MTPQIIITLLLNGLFTGAIYGLFASGLTFQLGSLSIANFGYGSWLILAMYTTFFALKIWNVPLAFVVLVLPVIYFAAGYVIRNRLLVGGSLNVQILSTIGIAMIVDGLIILFYSPAPRTLGIIEPLIEIAPGIRIGAIRLTVFILAAVLLVLFQLFLQRSHLGKVIRAVVLEKETAMLMGINSERIIGIAFGISFVLIAISGIMLIHLFPVTTSAGSSYQLMSFLIATIAGLGNMRGAFYAGLAIGVLNAFLLYFAASFVTVVIFSLFVVVLILRSGRTAGMRHI
ncbi:branched-chain amino acid transport system permease protein [Kaistia hirudinis]|uniref:Branched-chain amino acid transport system permease protein n=1 Tax=Kaistia hirudinis TaxID=1293440 RepID=A0A840AQM5_9HYPH|nr:branched-chain amino acid ABC transporter permease [Kaistia hirudinis]MBB3932569.1 branched-chain amino acid transport system permease protein [Kaistia hirudinis]